MYIFEVLSGFDGVAAASQYFLDHAVGGVIVESAVLADVEPVY